jgi:2-amino-4-hydroxy-6-hydroxymethyldihydropteridine diphosphokinase
MAEQHRVHLSLGSNIDPERNLPRAVELLKGYGPVEAVSTAWETEAVGTPGPHYLNACVLFRTVLPAPTLKERVIRPIEAALGRKRSEDRDAPRPIDLDIVLYDNQPYDLELWEYGFVIVPLAELCPERIHPQRGGKLSQVAEQMRLGGRMIARPNVLAPAR